VHRERALGAHGRLQAWPSTPASIAAESVRRQKRSRCRNASAAGRRFMPILRRAPASTCTGRAATACPEREVSVRVPWQSICRWQRTQKRTRPAFVTRAGAQALQAQGRARLRAGARREPGGIAGRADGGAGRVVGGRRGRARRAAGVGVLRAGVLGFVAVAVAVDVGLDVDLEEQLAVGGVLVWPGELGVGGRAGPKVGGAGAEVGVGELRAGGGQAAERQREAVAGADRQALGQGVHGAVGGRDRPRAADGGRLAVAQQPQR